MFVRSGAAFVSFLADHLAVLVRGAYRRSIQGLPYTFSFNIADRCPVGCKCYWRAQERVPELSDEEVVAFFEEKRRGGYVHANIVGGEPYVRPDLLTKVAGIIPFNWVLTSGTTPLRRLTNTTHIVSIDGANNETHDRVRRMRGLYARILKNLTKARRGGGFPTVIHTTLNALNYTEVGEIVGEWATNGLADGMMVSTLTPINGAGDNALRLSCGQRVYIVEELLRLRKKHPDFLWMTEAMIQRLGPDHTEKLHPGVCDTARWVESYDAAGNRIPQCILSDKANCRECGCVVTAMSDSVKSSRLGSMIESVAVMTKTFTIG